MSVWSRVWSGIEGFGRHVDTHYIKSHTSVSYNREGRDDSLMQPSALVLPLPDILPGCFPFINGRERGAGVCARER